MLAFSVRLVCGSAWGRPPHQSIHIQAADKSGRWKGNRIVTYSGIMRRGSITAVVLVALDRGSTLVYYCDWLIVHCKWNIVGLSWSKCSSIIPGCELNFSFLTLFRVVYNELISLIKFICSLVLVHAIYSRAKVHCWESRNGRHCWHSSTSSISRSNIPRLNILCL
jgi:hypothetical protein